MLAATIAQAGPFVLEPVDPGTYYSFASVAVDDSYGVAVAFNRANPVWSNLLFASRVGETWVVETVDPALASGFSPALAFDPSGNPHIAYGAGSVVKLASKSGALWRLWTVATLTSNQYAAYTNLVFDAAGVPHVTYHVESVDKRVAGGAALGLHYATKPGTVWLHEPIDTDSGAGSANSLTLDPQGVPAVAYIDNAQLWYAQRTGSAWVSTAVNPSQSGLGTYCSLEIDGGGDPHISYLGPAKTLEHAWKSAGTWNFEAVDLAGPTGYWNSLELDSAGDPWISYHNSVQGDLDLKLAHKVGGTWTVVDVTTAGVAGAGSSLVLDSFDHPWIGYYDQTNVEIRVARQDAAVATPLVALDGFAVAAPFPNPSRGSVSMTLRLDRAASVRLRLLDVSGRVVARRAARDFAAGTTLLTWDLPAAASGTYYLSVESTDGRKEAHRVVLIR